MRSWSRRSGQTTPRSSAQSCRVCAAGRQARCAAAPACEEPFQMTLSLTNRCNFRCSYCEIPLQERDEMRTPSGSPPSTSYKRAGWAAPASSVRAAAPQRRGRDIRHLKRRGVHTSMNTNGWLVAERIEDVADSTSSASHLMAPRRSTMASGIGVRTRASSARRDVAAAQHSIVTMRVVTPSGIDHVEHVLEIAARTESPPISPRARQTDGCPAAISRH